MICRTTPTCIATVDVFFSDAFSDASIARRHRSPDAAVWDPGRAVESQSSLC